MTKLRFTNKAVEDLSDIWNYTFEAWSEKQADLYYEMLIDSCREVAANPFLRGKRYDQIAENIYGCRVNRHIIFYRIVSEIEIEIVRILHGSMDLKNSFYAKK